jgi:hypothetical protein
MVCTGKWNFSQDWAAGSALTTPKNMIALSYSLMTGKILSPTTLKRMWTIQPPSPLYYGFEVPFLGFPKSPYTWVEKSGTTYGTTTLWIMCPQKKWSIFMGFNISDLRAQPVILTDTIIQNACSEVIRAMGWGT